jgi:hypothetical protein
VVGAALVPPALPPELVAALLPEWLAELEQPVPAITIHNVIAPTTNRDKNLDCMINPLEREEFRRLRMPTIEHVHLDRLPSSGKKVHPIYDHLAPITNG